MSKLLETVHYKLNDKSAHEYCNEFFDPFEISALESETRINLRLTTTATSFHFVVHQDQTPNMAKDPVYIKSRKERAIRLLRDFIYSDLEFLLHKLRYEITSDGDLNQMKCLNVLSEIFDEIKGL